MTEFVIMIDPVAKGRPRFGKGLTYTDPKTRRFEKDFRMLASAHKPIKPFLGPIELTLLFQIKKPKSVKRDQPFVKPDIDNLSKSVLDAMSDFWKDDGQIVRLYARKSYGPVPLIKVEITRPGEGSEQEVYK